MTIWLWSGFVAFVLVMLALDLGVVNRRAHAIRMREALAWTGFCVALALAFTVAVYFMYQHDLLGIATAYGAGRHGADAAGEFLTGWLLEYSLSLDNLFVIATIFAYFKIPDRYQHRVLFWGILGALVLRGVMIGLGAALIRQFAWVTYIFGALLLYSAFKMLMLREDRIDWEANLVVRAARRLFPIAPDLDGQRFFTRLGDGRRAITRLMLALMLVETADVIFAVDSIPAIFAVTKDPFLVFTSNVFAILGLRSMYFALAGVMNRFRHLKISLVIVLAYVAVKMLAQSVIHIEPWISLVVIVVVLAGGVIASLVSDQRALLERELELAADVDRIARATVRQTVRIVVFVVGALTVLIGVVMALPLMPGPGLVVILAGLALLATQFEWARRLLGMARERIAWLHRHARGLWARARGRAPEPRSDGAGEAQELLDVERDVDRRR